MSIKASKRRLAYTLALPAVFAIIVMVIFPMLYSASTSLTDYSLNITKPLSFTGLNNFIEALENKRFLSSVVITLKIAVSALIIETILGMILALLLNRKLIAKGAIIALLVTPVMLAPTATAFSFKLMLSPLYGPVNDILSKISGKPVTIDWLGSHQYALKSIVAVDVWQMTPFVMLILLAGLTSISLNLYEAAKIDGAKPFQIFFFITLPLLMPVLTVVVLFRAIDLLKFFDLPFVLTFGGPAQSTETISFFTYYAGMRFMRIGYASALSYIILIGICIIIALLNRVIKRLGELT